jgi:hypothetical protein
MPVFDLVPASVGDFSCFGLLTSSSIAIHGIRERVLISLAALGEELPLAIHALSAGNRKGNDHPLPWFDLFGPWAYTFHHSTAFMTEHITLLKLRDDA